MIIKKIKLNNIRSYTENVIDIPEGSVLLSGNIGSGKSSILLAIDFALFGLRKGELTGSGLLRNGEDKGSVELEFELNNLNIEIKRTLKRAGESVSQDTGFIKINENKEDLSAIELKEKILNLLGYPKSLLTKSKNLIFRYTVYTPQEEMKEILTGDNDIRLDTLRKVFGIDKYKRINENAKILVSSLKEQRKELEGKTSDLDEKVRDREKKGKEYLVYHEKKISIAPLVEEIKEKIKAKREEIKEKETEREKISNLKRDISINKNQIVYKQERINKNKSEIEVLEKFISENKKIETTDISVIKKEIEELNIKIKSLETEISDLNSTKSEAAIEKRSSESLISSVNSLDICPICKQKVEERHKHDIEEVERKKEKDADNIIKEVLIKQEKINKELEKIKYEYERKREVERNTELNSLKNKRIDEKKELKIKLESEIKEAEKETELFIEKNKDLEKQVSQFDITVYDVIKNELDSFLVQERRLDIEKAGYEKDLERIQIEKERLDLEIKKKTKEKEEINKLSKLIFFISEHFTELMELMERKIMLKVHTDFDTLFQKWFSVLVDDEVIKVKLDESFTPVIEQQGYNIEYTHLSGGERTAAALSYRLALNQTINKIITEIKTRDIIILDEPTDGFSSEQLDRMKNVLEEIEAKQIILVSHDPKIESFVNKVIRVEKQGGGSRII
ncbi:AAA family ATPase [Candidatus Woesearchaeota archaeon]|nr:AAA family ATPase [Candidatus Woesearchaeota archaeon]